MRGKHNLQGGFSLVEIVLAIGIISFAMVSLLGLMSVLFTNSKESKDDTLIPAMARTVVEKLRASAPAASFPPITTPETYYFTGEGIYQGPTAEDDSIYECTVDPKVGPGYTTYPRIPEGKDPIVLGSHGPRDTLFRFTMTFKWPVSAANPNKYVIPASIARYESPPISP